MVKIFFQIIKKTSRFEKNKMRQGEEAEWCWGREAAVRDSGLEGLAAEEAASG